MSRKKDEKEKTTGPHKPAFDPGHKPHPDKDSHNDDDIAGPIVKPAADSGGNPTVPPPNPGKP